MTPPVFAEPPNLGEEVKEGRMVSSPHYYDGLTMLGKRGCLCPYLSLTSQADMCSTRLVDDFQVFD